MPPEKLGGVTIGEAQALEIARTFLLEEYEGAARITGHRFHQYNLGYETRAHHGRVLPSHPDPADPWWDWQANDPGVQELA
ncbi:MAG: hypothetical protein AB7Y46_18620 [Armatimonadota bacterium]